MVIGNGLMAQTFSAYKNNEEIIIFASGVSNSLETNQAAFKREFELLKITLNSYPTAKLVYFSTVSIDDLTVNNRPYVQHKIAMEAYIKKIATNYLIFRISNVVGSQGNSHTIVNYLVNAVKNNINIDIWRQAERNLIDSDDVKFIVDNLLEDGVCNKIINIATRESVLVPAILSQIEVYLQKKGNVNLIPKGKALNLDISYIKPLLKEIEASKGKGVAYIANLLKKYY